MRISKKHFLLNLYPKISISYLDFSGNDYKQVAKLIAVYFIQVINLHLKMGLKQLMTVKQEACCSVTMNDTHEGMSVNNFRHECTAENKNKVQHAKYATNVSSTFSTTSSCRLIFALVFYRVLCTNKQFVCL